MPKGKPQNDKQRRAAGINRALFTISGAKGSLGGSMDAVTKALLEEKNPNGSYSQNLDNALSSLIRARDALATAEASLRAYNFAKTGNIPKAIARDMKGYHPSDVVLLPPRYQLYIEKAKELNLFQGTIW